MSGRQYMWAGPGDDPTYKKLDRVLVSTEWEHKYPLSTVESRDRNILDHTPLILITGASTHQNRQPTFKFERGWLTRDGFFDMVADIWQSECRGYTTLERWQNKIRNLIQYLRGWAKHTTGIYRKEKKSLISLIDLLDKKVETSILSDNEINMKHYLKGRLVTLLREEEIKWYERAKVQNLLQGDDNTRFFHLIATNKYRKQHIFRLEQEDGIIVGDNKLKRYITRYYKNLFGQPVESDIHLDESHIDGIPHVTNTENEILTSPFTMYEIKEAVFQMEHNKAPGADGFPAEFYQVFWEIIKEDLLALFLDFYDKVKLSFLQQALRMKGFSTKWCRWIEGMVTGGSVGIKVNDEVGHYFQTKRGLRQRDPISPILFNIVADMLAILIKRAKEDEKINGIIPHLVDDGLSIL
jgi:hypothetical protein